VRRFFQTCIDIEKTIGLIYRQLAQSVAYPAELSAIWWQLAQEEDQHARDLAFAARLPDDGIFAPKSHLLLQLEQMLGVVRDVLQRTRKEALSEKDAVLLSLKLESEFLALHVTSAMEFKNASFAKMFAAIARGDEVHCRAIKRYYADNFPA